MSRWTEWLIIAVFGALLAWGLTSNYYTAKISVLDATIDAVSEQVKVEKKQGEDNAKKLKKTYDGNVAAIKRYYQRLLQPVPTAPGASSVAASASSDDGASSEQGVPRCSAEFRVACLKDANSVEMWREYATRNNIPIQ